MESKFLTLACTNFDVTFHIGSKKQVLTVEVSLGPWPVVQGGEGFCIEEGSNGCGQRLSESLYLLAIQGAP